MENYVVTIPGDLSPGTYYLSAQLNYCRMPDPLAGVLGIEKRPVLEVSRDVRELAVD